MVKPEWGIWFILIALFPLILRIVVGKVSFRKVITTDWFVLVFLITAWVGYWAAYDQGAAWNKVWMIVTGVLLYYSLSTQPRENLIWISLFFFLIGMGVALYYFLTYDFVAAPRKLEFVNNIGRLIMKIRPQTSWKSIHPNYVAGLIAITVPFILYPIRQFKRNNLLFHVFVVVGLVLTGIALVMATSRGVVLAIVSGVGVWVLWRIISVNNGKRQIKSDSVFPVVILIYLAIVIAFLYMGPAQSGDAISSNYHYGNGSRAELFGRSVYLLSSFALTGGGLGSFPGLYSQYLLGIPFFNVPNSHNLFLDVGIEQGVFGGFSFLILYLAGLWVTSLSIVKKDNDELFKWIILFALIVAIVHGMVDDYLYNGVGSMLSLFLIGLSVNGKRDVSSQLHAPKYDIRKATTIVVIWIAIIAINFNLIRSVWYANLGSVQLAKVELAGFPDTGWAGDGILPELDTATASLQTALQIDPANRTANQRLGLILMLHRNFETAAYYLKIAHQLAPDHRGINKSLGYCYVWLGNMEEAQKFLSRIPETREELDVYVWWWKAQGRNDLSENASLALSVLPDSRP